MAKNARPRGLLSEDSHSLVVTTLWIFRFSIFSTNTTWYCITNEYFSSIEIDLLSDDDFEIFELVDFSDTYLNLQAAWDGR